MELEMKIRGLMMDPVTNMPIVILKDVSGNSVLPIWVGIYEANAIALEIEKVSTQRPMTHDLIKSLLLGLNTGIKKVVVNELKEDTFYALIWLERDGELISVDSRPSDALALALRLDCPIFVDDTVLNSSKLTAHVSDKVNTEELRRWLEGLNDEDLGRYKMQVREKLERLAAAGIQLLPAVEITTHYVFERDGFVALVERTPDGFGGIGSPGILTGNGFAALIHRGDRSYFVAKNFEQQAQPDQVAALQRFSRDLKSALG